MRQMPRFFASGAATCPQGELVDDDDAAGGQDPGRVDRGTLLAVAAVEGRQVERTVLLDGPSVVTDAAARAVCEGVHEAALCRAASSRLRRL